MTAADVDALDKLRWTLTGAIECSDIDLRIAEIVNVLLPVVDRIANERAAAELEAAVVEISRDRDNCPNKIRRQGYGGALYVLKARHAAALRADHQDPK